jgi:hypothetical protein
MIKWLIAVVKCRQIARQMLLSLGRDTVLDAALISTSEFDDLMNNDDIFKWTTVTCHSDVNQSLRPSDFMSITNRYRTSLFTTRW